jgi:ABC-type arginine/histidine transport system permease subunit
MNRKLTLLFLLLPIALAIGVSHAQTPMIIVPAASPAAVTTTTSATVATSPSDSTSLASVITLLQEMKATNAETLKKQEAVLQQLDELQKAAEQMKAFGKRG